MNTTEAGLILTKASAYDRRTVGRGDCEAWAEAMTHGAIRLPDALEAVSQHYTESANWLMPVHVIQRVAQIRKARLAGAPVMIIPKDLHQAVERQWQKAFTEAVKDGEDDPHAVADQAMGIKRREEIEMRRDMSVLQMRPGRAS